MAYISSFDRCRIHSCAEKLLPDLDDYDVQWLDTRRLIGDEMVYDDDGRVIDKGAKLSEIFRHRMKEYESFDVR